MSIEAIAATGKIHPLTGQPLSPRIQPKPRVEVSALARPTRKIDATYDAASDSTEHQNYWANADNYDADSANSQIVRRKLVARSRYEVANNGFADGIVQTYATDLVGIGPKLRMQTASPAFNRMVEAEWQRWSKAIQLRRKLWCMAHAKLQDGESFGIASTNPKVKHQVKLDIKLIETEQCSSPYLNNDVGTYGYIDGIKFDEFGNPEFFDILTHHPGANGYVTFVPTSTQIPAEYMLHWFIMRRPGQHRGVPEFRSTLNTGASSRRFREATVASAETAADFSVFLKTQYPPDSDELDSVAPMSTMSIQKRMMTALPNSVEPFQMEAKHPNATYESFVRSQISEMARPKSMPYNKAACDSSSYNYASGRLDHQTYYAALDVEREDGNDLVLDPLFELWFREAVMVFGWFGGQQPQFMPTKTWDWPKHQVADIGAEASSRDVNLRNGTLSLSLAYAEEGEDFEDEVSTLARDYFGDDTDASIQKTREMIRNSLFNNQNQQASMAMADTQEKQANTAAKVANSNTQQPQGTAANG